MGDIEVDLVSDLGTTLSLSSLSEEEEDSGEDHQEADQDALNGRHVAWGRCVVSRSPMAAEEERCSEMWGNRGQRS